MNAGICGACDWCHAAVQPRNRRRGTGPQCGAKNGLTAVHEGPVHEPGTELVGGKEIKVEAIK